MDSPRVLSQNVFQTRKIKDLGSEGEDQLHFYNTCGRSQASTQNLEQRILIAPWMTQPPSGQQINY